MGRLKSTAYLTSRGKETLKYISVTSYIISKYKLKIKIWKTVLLLIWVQSMPLVLLITNLSKYLTKRVWNKYAIMKYLSRNQKLKKNHLIINKWIGFMTKTKVILNMKKY